MVGSSSRFSQGMAVGPCEKGTVSRSGAGAVSGLNSGSRSGDFDGSELVMREYEVRGVWWKDDVLVKVEFAELMVGEFALLNVSKSG